MYILLLHIMGSESSPELLAIGNLLRVADSGSPVHKVISTYNISASDNINAKNITKYDRQMLDDCAIFLKVDILDLDNKPIYSNKEKITNRIICGIKSYLPRV